MNKLEKIVYNLVKENPKLKLKLRNIYQSIFDLIPDKKNFFIKSIKYKEGYFFGFHDVSPFSYDEKYILSNKLNIELRMPNNEDALTVGYWDKNFENYIELSDTYAWNYHKGCRLQWCGEKSHNCIFNNVENNKLIANIISIDTNEIKKIDYAIDTVSPNGMFATSFSYERLNRYMPGYGYNYSDEACFEENTSNKTGLFLIDIKNNTRKLIVSLEQLSKIEYEDTMKNAHHYVTHTEFSPDGERIAFLHRWTYEDPNKRYTRLVTCKLDGSDIYVSNTTGMVSHYDWNEEYGILAYCRVNNIDGHYIFPTYKMDKSYRVAEKLNSDGHQSYIPNSKYFITDTYPDKYRYSKLYLCNIESKDTKLIVDVKSYKKFQSPNVYKHWACDLHPRVSPLGNYVCFDSVYPGKRALCIMPIKDLYKK